MNSLNLETAFDIIQNLLKEKDNRIKELEDENYKLRNKLKEMKINSPYVDHIEKERKILIDSNNKIIEMNNHKNTYYSNRNNEIINNYKNNINFNSINNVINNENNLNYNNNSIITNKLISTPNTTGTNINLEKTPTPLNKSTESRNEVKYFLQEVKERVLSKDFKEFIKYIKILTDKANTNINRKEIFENVKDLFNIQNSDLYEKFELILAIKK